MLPEPEAALPPAKIEPLGVVVVGAGLASFAAPKTELLLSVLVSVAVVVAVDNDVPPNIELPVEIALAAKMELEGAAGLVSFPAAAPNKLEPELVAPPNTDLGASWAEEEVLPPNTDLFDSTVVAEPNNVMSFR